jgi:uncharacterized protein (DUF1501 family)
MQRRQLIQMAAIAALLPLAPFAASQANGYNGRRVILLKLGGANDGLNTLVPWSDDRYHALRPTIGLAENQIIQLNDDFALHEALESLMPLWEAGELSLIHGLGYPQPNRSHFKSIALWETGGDGQQPGRDGWITHDVEHAFATNQLDAYGITLGGGMGVFSNATGNWLSMNTADQYNGVTAPTIAAAGKPNSAMQALLESASTLQLSLNRLSSKMQALETRAHVRGGKLAQQVTHAINLINAGVQAPVIKISLTGFDTHDNQLARHANLLKQLASSIAALRSELKKSGEWDNTLLVTYSEFGRRARENRSGGTDHGTAAAHFVTGGLVRGGLYGDMPDLGKLTEDDLQFTMDYRAVYSRVLSEWLQLPSDRFSNFADRRLNKLLV